MYKLHLVIQLYVLVTNISTTYKSVILKFVCKFYRDSEILISALYHTYMA